MTTSTDAQLRTRTHLADEALVAINVARARRAAAAPTQTIPAATFTEYRDEAYRLILIALRSRETAVLPEDITRPDDLIDAECALLCVLLFTAASSRPDDVFALAAVEWRARYDRAIAAASPIDGVRGVGRSFSWNRA